MAYVAKLGHRLAKLGHWLWIRTVDRQSAVWYQTTITASTTYLNLGVETSMVKTQWIKDWIRGDKDTLALTVEREDKAAMDWSDYTFTFVGRPAIPAGSVTDDSSVAFAKSGAAITASSLTGRRITFYVTLYKTDTYSIEVGTNGIREVTCELQATKAGDPITLSRGTLRIIGDVARA